MQYKLVFRSLMAIVMYLLLSIYANPPQALYAAGNAQQPPVAAAASGGPWTNFADPLRDPILVMVKGSNDTLWIGSRSGLSIRSNEGKWLTLTTNDGLAGSTVFTIFNDPKNPNLHWIGTNRGASLLDDGGAPMDKSKHRWINFRKEDGMAGSRVSSIAMTPEGLLWFGLSYVDLLYCEERGDGIAILDTKGTPFDKSDDVWSSMTAENSNLPNNIIRRMTTDANGTIWISMQGSLNAYQNGKWISYSTDQGLPSNDITALTIAGSQVWVGMRDSFGLLDYGTSLTDRSDDKWQTFAYTYTYVYSYTYDYGYGYSYTYTETITDTVKNISALSLDDAGHVWIGQNNFNSLCSSGSDRGYAFVLDTAKTPFALDDDTWATLTDPQASAVRAMLTDGSNTYFANRDEVYKLGYDSTPTNTASYQWSTLLSSDGFVGTTVSAVAGNLGVAMGPYFVQDGSLYQLDYQATPHDRKDDDYYYLTYPGTATDLLIDANGYAWVGGDGMTVYTTSLEVYDPYEVGYSKDFGLADNQINDMAMDAQGSVWIATGDIFNGGLNVLDTGKKIDDVRDDRWATFTSQQNGVLGEQITAIALQTDGVAWVGSNKGLARLSYGASPFDKTDDSWQQFTTANSGLANNYIRAMALDSNGNLWLALAAGGVSVLGKDGTWTTFSESDGLVYNSLNTLAIDNNNRVWLGSDGEGISVLNIAGTLQNKQDDQWISYRPQETLLSGYIRKIYIDPWDQAWVGTFGGGFSLYSVTEFSRTYLPLISSDGTETVEDSVVVTPVLP